MTNRSDFTMHYIDSPVGDVNGDGEINIADINALLDLILGGD